MTEQRKGLFAVLIIGCLIALIGTVMSSHLELGIVNGFGIALVFLSRKALRIQENHEFISTNDPSGRWVQMKKEAGRIFCAIGITLFVIATILIGTIMNIATAVGVIIFLLGAGKLMKPRTIRNHNKSVVKVMKLFEFPSELILKAQGMGRQCVVA